MPASPVTLHSDGIPLAAYLHLPDGDGPFPGVVLCHGFPPDMPLAAGDPGYKPLATALAAAGLATIAYSARGVSPSGGNFSLLGWVQDCRSAVDYLADHPSVDANRLGVVGFSSGGCIAFYLAAQDHRIKATASVGTPARYRTMERANGDPNFVIARFRSWGHIKDPDFPSSPEEWGKEWDMVVAQEAIAKISPRAVLIIHGNKDAIVAMQDARALYDAAGDPRELYQIGDAEHILRNDPRVEAMLRSWLSRSLGA